MAKNQSGSSNNHDVDIPPVPIGLAVGCAMTLLVCGVIVLCYLKIYLDKLDEE